MTSRLRRLPLGQRSRFVPDAVADRTPAQVVEKPGQLQRLCGFVAQFHTLRRGRCEIRHSPGVADEPAALAVGEVRCRLGDDEPVGVPDPQQGSRLGVEKRSQSDGRSKSVNSSSTSRANTRDTRGSNCPSARAEATARAAPTPPARRYNSITVAKSMILMGSGIASRQAGWG